MRKHIISLAVVVGIVLTATVTGAQAGTATWAVRGAAYWTNDADTQLTVRDTLGDNRKAVGYFYRKGSESTIQSVTADGYLAQSTSPTGSKILKIRACARNSNPLDVNYCSSFHNP